MGSQWRQIQWRSKHWRRSLEVLEYKVGTTRLDFQIKFSGIRFSKMPPKQRKIALMGFRSVGESFVLAPIEPQSCWMSCPRKPSRSRAKAVIVDMSNTLGLGLFPGLRSRFRIIYRWDAFPETVSTLMSPVQVLLEGWMLLGLEMINLRNIWIRTCLLILQFFSIVLFPSELVSNCQLFIQQLLQTIVNCRSLHCISLSCIQWRIVPFYYWLPCY